MSELDGPTDLCALCRRAFEIMITVVEAETDGFSLAALYKPGEPMLDQDGHIVFRVDGMAMSMALFLERLYDRIAELSENSESLSTVRQFLDTTRDLRAKAFGDPKTLRTASDEIDVLIESMFANANAAAARLLRRQQAQHLTWISASG